MPTPIITAFSTGEINPQMRGRVDIDKYPYACEELTNFVVTPLGGAMKCPGTAYVATSKTDGKHVIILPVKYSSIDSYVLEIGEGYIRFYSANAQILLGGSPYELSTPFIESDLVNTDGSVKLRYAQSIDIIYLLNENYMLQLQRYDDTIWGLTTLRLQDGPYNDTNVTDITLTPSAATGLKFTQDGIAYGANIYVVAGAQYIHSSPDGIVWTNRYGPAAGLRFNSLRFLNSLFLAVSSGATILGSANGTSWTGYGPFADVLNDIGYVTASNLFITVGQAGTIYTLAGNLGASTQITVAGLTANLKGVVCSTGTTAVFVGEGKYGYTTNAGTTWTVGDTPDSITFNTVEYANGKYFAAGDDGKIYVSDDITAGFTSEITCPISVHIHKFLLVHSSTYLYAVANQGYVIAINVQTSEIEQIVRIDPNTNIYQACFDGDDHIWLCGNTAMVYNGSIAVDRTGAAGTGLIPFYDIKEHSLVTKTLTATDDLFYTSDIGKPIRVKGTSDWGWGTIQKITSKKIAVIDERETIAGVTATTEWRIGSFYPNGGYPTVIDFHEQRLVFANKQTRWGSRSNDFPNFSPTEPDDTVVDSNATTDIIAAGEHDEIFWLKSGDMQLIGTSSGCADVQGEFAGIRGIWRASGSGSDLPITPADKIYKNQSATVIYIQKHGRKIADLFFNYDINGYDSTDLTKLSSHITKPGIIKVAWQNEPFGILWGLRSDGVLIGLTYDRKQKFVAWWRRSFVDATVEDFCIIPGDGQDQLWLVLNRTIGATAKRHICYMKNFDFDSEEIDFDQEEATLDPDAFFVDDGITYSGVSTTTITGLLHLEGKEVYVLGNSLVQGPFTVSGGEIELDTAVTKAQVGKSYAARLKTIDIEVAAAGSTSQGKIKRIQEVGIRLHESGDVWYGSSWSKLDKKAITTGKVFTGDINKQFPSGYKGKAYIYLKSIDPVPCTVLALMPRVEIYDR